MLTGFEWLALEVKDVERASEFYGETLSLSPRERASTEPGSEHASTGPGSERAFAVGGADLVVRRPTDVPRGGVHTHYALSIPAAEYDEWWDRLADANDLVESRFGSAKSLYLYDPDGNCVELGQSDVPGPGVDGLFEVALEVESLARAEAFYAALGFETVDRGDGRARVRMDGPVALELWEPRLGIADARGGVHVDLGFETADPGAAADAVADRAAQIEPVGDGESVAVRDPDGHHLTFLES